VPEPRRAGGSRMYAFSLSLFPICPNDIPEQNVPVNKLFGARPRGPRAAVGVIGPV
jgi:hypothetical protein